MADYRTYTPTTYRGSSIGRDITLGKKSVYPPKTVGIYIDWSQYPTNCVEINLGPGTGQVINSLDWIKSVYIDNEDHATSVDVQFPDTLFRTTAKANAIISAQVITNQTIAYIMRDTTTLGPGFTNVYFANFILDPYTQEQVAFVNDLWLGSSLPNGSVIFGPPTLGQRHVQRYLPLNLNFTTPEFFGGPYTRGAIIFKGFRVALTGVYSDSVPWAAMNITFGSIATTYKNWRWLAPNNLSFVGYKELENTFALNFPVDATQTIFISSALGMTCAGNIIIDIFYDYTTGGF